MLITFSVKDFGIIKDPQTLFLSPEKTRIRKLYSDNYHLTKKGRNLQRIMKSIVLFGGNDTGKTTMMTGTSTMKSIILGLDEDKDILSEDGTMFLAEFFIDGKVWSYEIVCNNKMQILKEGFYIDDNIIFEDTEVKDSLRDSGDVTIVQDLIKNMVTVEKTYTKEDLEKSDIDREEFEIFGDSVLNLFGATDLNHGGDLIYKLYLAKKGATVFIDNFDWGLSARGLLCLFSDIVHTDDFKGQLIVVAHNTGLLNNVIFDPQQIYICDRENGIYPLSVFKNINIAPNMLQRKFIQGAFGGLVKTQKNTLFSTCKRMDI